jgi:hypothetical protein
MIGSLADWVTAGTAFLALVVATVGGIATWRTNRAQQETLELQRRQLDMAQQQVERMQAVKITYGLGSDLAKRMHDLRGPTSTPPEEPDVGAALVVVNTSDSPIYMVTLMEGVETPRLWVPRTWSPHATCTYSWMRPPSRFRRSGRTVAPERGGVLPRGGR